MTPQEAKVCRLALIKLSVQRHNSHRLRVAMASASYLRPGDSFETRETCNLCSVKYEEIGCRLHVYIKVNTLCWDCHGDVKAVAKTDIASSVKAAYFRSRRQEFAVTENRKIYWNRLCELCRFQAWYSVQKTLQKDATSLEYLRGLCPFCYVNVEAFCFIPRCFATREMMADMVPLLWQKDHDSDNCVECKIAAEH